MNDLELDLDTKAKLYALKEFLKANGLTWMPCKKADQLPKADMRIIEHDINVRISRDEESDHFFYKRYRHRHPVFIRPSDTADFVIEKVQNAIIDAMRRAQSTRARILKKQNDEKSK